MSNLQEYHVPVLLKESIDGLNIKPGGVYVDVTFGGGGHSKEILSRMKGGRLISLDQDDDAEKNANGIDDDCFSFVSGNFLHLKRYLKMVGVTQVDGILADLGVSSHQFNEAERGFSFRFDADLDMRMDRRKELDAKQVLNEYETSDLSRIFFEYGELKNARRIADIISSERIMHPIETVNELIELVKPFCPRGRENKMLAKIFQALRIEVNQEMDVLKQFLIQSAELLNPEGRLSVISYHSLEDRLVKNFINTGKFRGEVEKDLYGNALRPFEKVTRKPIVPSAKEIEQNNRARSAKLRVAEKS